MNVTFFKDLQIWLEWLDLNIVQKMNLNIRCKWYWDIPSVDVVPPYISFFCEHFSSQLHNAKTSYSHNMLFQLLLSICHQILITQSVWLYSLEFHIYSVTLDLIAFREASYLCVTHPIAFRKASN